MLQVFALSVCLFNIRDDNISVIHTDYYVKTQRFAGFLASTQLTDMVLSFMYHMSIYDTG